MLADSLTANRLEERYGTDLLAGVAYGGAGWETQTASDALRGRRLAGGEADPEYAPLPVQRVAPARTAAEGDIETNNDKANGILTGY